VLPPSVREANESNGDNASFDAQPPECKSRPRDCYP
jgi:hypothetical protein